MSRSSARRAVSYAGGVRSPSSSRTPVALAGVAVTGVLGIALSACGPSLVDMEDHPITSSTPSRAAGEELIRSGDPSENCASEPLTADEGMTAEVPVSYDESHSDAPRTERVPTEPRRILALGYGAADAACALGLTDRVVATSALPGDASAVLPERLTEAPLVDPKDPAFPSQVADLDPDVVLLGNDAGASAAELHDLLGDGSVPIVSYESADGPTSWSDSAALAGAALGRAGTMRFLLKDFLGKAEDAAKASRPSDTRVSVVQFANGEPRIAAPNIQGVQILTAMGASRPPSQLVDTDGTPVPPPEHDPAVGDPLSGDVIFSIAPTVPGGQDMMREVFGSERWKALAPVKERRMFVVQPAVWEGRGLVSARLAVEDIASNVNRFAADG